jgi:hypothetical protein
MASHRRPASRRSAVAAALVVAAAASPSAALAAYWFWQGYLPKSDGARTVLNAFSPYEYDYIRMSWNGLATDNMNFVDTLRINGRWEIIWTGHVVSYDIDFGPDNGAYYASGGCQVPQGVVGQVYTNCHTGPDA